MANWARICRDALCLSPEVRLGRKLRSAAGVRVQPFIPHWARTLLPTLGAGIPPGNPRELRMRAAVLLLLLLAAALVSASARPEEGSVVLQAADAPLSPLSEGGQALTTEDRARRDAEAEERVKRSPQRRPILPLPLPGRPRPGRPGRPGR
ncbi:Protein of unknown function [Gryllus bimaculatus]|nr:Protein of unknown function [Gryllus bimaculatus]